MSSFFDSLLSGKIPTKQPQLQQQQQPVRPTTATSASSVSTGRTVIHGKNVIILNKMNKGYSGRVIEVFPPKVNISYEKEILVPKYSYANATVGTIVIVQTLRKTGKIIKEYPVLYKIKTDTGSEYSLAREFYDRIIRFKDQDPTGKSIYLSGVFVDQIVQAGVTEYQIKVGDTMYSKRLLDVFDEKWRIKGTGTGMDGQEGKLIGSVPEQFVISVPLTSWLPINYVSKRDPKTGLVTILYGDDKNTVGKIIGTLPRSYKITIGPLNKQVTKFGNVPITAKDLFFKDIRVRIQDAGNSGNVVPVQDAEVISVTGSNFNIKLRDGTLKTIKDTDIVSYNDGFQLLQKADSVVELEGEPSTLVTEVLTSTDGVGQEAIGEFEESGSGPIEFAEPEQEPEQEMREFEEEQPGTEQEPEQEQEFKMSYKDLERITKMMDSLSKEEQKIKDTIISIVEKAFVVNMSDINIRNLLDDILTVEKHVNSELEKKGKVDIFSKNDRKFLIVAVVYQHLLRKRLIPVSTNYNVVLGDLIKTNFFKPVDTQNSSWKYLGTGSSRGTTNFEKDILYLATIAKEFTETILGSLASFAEEIKLLREQPVEIFPVGTSRQDENQPELAYTQQGRKQGQSVLSYYKRQSVDYPERGEAIKKFPTFSDIEKGIKLRPDAKMMWTPQQQNIINALKRKLTKSLETSKEMKNRRSIVQYAIGCLDNIYVEIENLKNNNQRIKELHYLQQLATILNREFEKLKVHQSMETLKKSLQEEEKRQRLLAKSEGVLPSEPEPKLVTEPEPASESSSMDLDDITKSLESMKIQIKAKAPSVSDTEMDLS